ncbi:MAG: prolyl oligopeptidase family serine peptidase, partial [Parvularculaceae bacterium]|nr:prolyl oligopeptidase family serine peptidase [Parvularculaceae bacterium]
LRRDWGGVEVRDVKAGVDWAIAQGIADPARLGVYGWSWGGILTNYMIASDPRFAAAISGAGMGNFLAAYGTDQYAVYYDAELGAPFEAQDLWRKLSYPFFDAKKIRTPTLYQCADQDDNVPCVGALQMYSALKRTGVPTRLVVFPGETHSLSTPSYLEREIEMNIDWFRRWTSPKPSVKP